MNFADYCEIGLFLLLVVVSVPILGHYISRVFDETKQIKVPFLTFLENFLYKICRINPREEMTWKGYAVYLLFFNAAGGVLVFIVQVFQKYFVLNPENMKNVSPLLALNTAVSFMTNTNWQAYAGETTVSYLTQMFALAVQNFLSAATAIAVFAALSRAFTRVSKNTIGNVWTDLVKSIIYILLPLSFVFSLFLIQQGVVQTFSSYVNATTLEGVQQKIPLGPVASQIAIKMLGVNGGGFFNANSAHPFENPTPLTNFFEIISILLIPAALTYSFGKLTRAKKQGEILFAAMFILLIVSLSVALFAEYQHNPVLNVSGCMEGKEVRFGITGSMVFSTVTTAASCGAVNCMHESLSPLSILVLLFNMMTGEVIFGGAGSGLYGMILYAIITVFIAGLMVGRTPEFLGKKIEAFEIKMAVIGILSSPILLLLSAAFACSSKEGISALSEQGITGLNEIIYAFTSTSNNNGSALSGLYAGTPFYLILTSLTMIIGRFSTMVAAIAIAGKLALKKIQPQSSGTFPTDGALFLLLLIGTIILVGALSFFPVLSLGPILQHLLYFAGSRT